MKRTGYKICANGTAIWDPTVLIIDIGISSHPLLCLFLHSCKMSIISSDVVGSI